MKRTKKKKKRALAQGRLPAFLAQEEARRLFAVIKDKRDRAIFLTAYRHGLRASEVGVALKDRPRLKTRPAHRAPR